METTDIGWLGLAASLVMDGVVVGVSVARRLGLERDLLVASGRAVAQLALAGYALRVVLDEDASIAWAWVWVAAIIPVAALTARRREPRLPRIGWAVAGAYALGLGVTLAVVFGLDIFPLEATALIPVSAMIVGNSLKVVVVAGTRLVDAMYERRTEVENMLALGFDRWAATSDLVRDALRLSLRPQIETTRSVGMVFLPGTLTGLVLAGVDPVDAALIQAAILFLILGSAAIAAVVVTAVAVTSFTTSDERLVLPELEAFADP